MDADLMGHKVIEARAVIAEEYGDLAEQIASYLNQIFANQSDRFVEWGVEVVEEVE